jgi:class 3 adenylate cyclase
MMASLDVLMTPRRPSTGHRAFSLKAFAVALAAKRALRLAPAPGEPGAAVSNDLSAHAGEAVFHAFNLRLAIAGFRRDELRDATSVFCCHVTVFVRAAAGRLGLRLSVIALWERTRCTSTPSVERRLAAILALDVVGYGRLHGCRRGRDLDRPQGPSGGIGSNLWSRSITDAWSRPPETGCSWSSTSVVDAIACAVAIQRGMLSRNQTSRRTKRIVFRIGINIGDIIIDEGDIFGDGVNVAARLENALRAGRGLHLARRERPGSRQAFRCLSPTWASMRVKNIARTIGVFGCRPSDIAALPEDEPTLEAASAVSRRLLRPGDIISGWD